MKRVACSALVSLMLITVVLITFGAISPVKANATAPFAYVYDIDGWAGNTMSDEMTILNSIDPSKYAFDWYNELNIMDLWTNLAVYKAILIEEDSFYVNGDPSSGWGGDLLNSFQSHATDLASWVMSGGGIFTSGENNLQATQVWDFLPPGMQVTSNDPEVTSNVHIVYDPGAPNGLYSYPNSITDAYLSGGHTHAWFTSWDPGYVVTVHRDDNDEAIELFGAFGSGCIVVSHVEAEARLPNAWEYLQNQLDFIVPPTTYTLTITSPISSSVFYSGDTVIINAEIKDNLGNPGSGATVTANSPTGAPITLTETGPGTGIYTTSYTITPSDPIGDWIITVVGSIGGQFPKDTVTVHIIPPQAIPEVPFGTVMTLLSMIIALVGFVGSKRFRPKFPPQ